VRPQLVQMRTPGGNSGFGPDLLRVAITDSAEGIVYSGMTPRAAARGTTYNDRGCKECP